jgi:hypothetical protein
MIDNSIYACAYGLKKKARVQSLFLETLLILILMGMNVYEIVNTDTRFC